SYIVLKHVYNAQEPVRSYDVRVYRGIRRQSRRLVRDFFPHEMSVRMLLKPLALGPLTQRAALPIAVAAARRPAACSPTGFRRPEEVRGDPMIKAILVPATGSNRDNAVFTSALAVARKFAAHLDFLHVRVDAAAMAATMAADGGGAVMIGGLVERIEEDAE